MTKIAEQGWMTARAPRRLFELLGDARFVGGCVRDGLLGLTPKDIDIATSLPPEQVMARLAAAGIRVVPTGLAHGTVTAVLDGTSIEITTLRRDVACDGRHAEVAFTDDWRLDASRRDFTINALSCSADGTLYDPFGGAADLAAGRVRFVGDAIQRLGEDVLRLLRFFRFQTRFGRPPPDPEALAACRTMAPLLPGLSGERVRAELFGLLALEGCPEAWRLMTDAGVIPHLLPAATDTRRLATLVGLEKALGLPAGNRPMVRLAALLPANRATALAVAGRLRLSRAERARLVGLAAPPDAITPTDPPGRLRRALVALSDAERFCDLILLAASASPSVSPSPPPADSLSPMLALAGQWAAARFPLSGDDVLKAGIEPGPALGQQLAALQDWWADHAFLPDRSACLAELARRQTEDKPRVTAPDSR